MNIIKYQGAAMLGALAGDIVSWQGISWTATEQGHLEASVAEDDASALELLDVGVISKQSN